MKSETCAIVGDLLPTYQEGLLAEETRAFVEKHLAECDTCAAAYGRMHKALPVQPINADVESLKAVKKTYRRIVKRRWWIAILAIVMTIVVWSGVVSFLDGLKIPIAPEDLDVAVLYATEQGDLYAALDSYTYYLWFDSWWHAVHSDFNGTISIELTRRFHKRVSINATRPMPIDTLHIIDGRVYERYRYDAASFGDPHMGEVTTIRVGNAQTGYKTLWTKGEELQVRERWDDIYLDDPVLLDPASVGVASPTPNRAVP